MISMVHSEGSAFLIHPDILDADIPLEPQPIRANRSRITAQSIARMLVDFARANNREIDQRTAWDFEAQLTKSMLESKAVDHSMTMIVKALREPKSRASVIAIADRLARTGRAGHNVLDDQVA